MAFSLCALGAAAAAPPPLTATVRSSAPANLYLENELRDGRAELTATLRNTGGQSLQGRWTATATDYWDRERAVEPSEGALTIAGGQQATATVRVQPNGRGFYLVRLKVEVQGYDAVEVAQPFDVLWAPIGGPRPDSFFQGRGAGGGEAPRAEICRRIGLKVDRTAIAAEVQGAAPAQPGGAYDLDLEGLRRRLDVGRSYEVSFVPVVLNLHPDLRSAAAKEREALGPPRDVQEFLGMYEPSVKAGQAFGVRWYQFWDAPRAGGSIWAGPVQTYREYLKAFAQRMKAARADVRVLVSGSPAFLTDVVEPYPESWKGAVGGTSSAIQTDPEVLSYRRGALQRSMDLAVQAGRRMGLRPHFAAVGDDGARGQPAADIPGYHEGRQSATRLVTAHIIGALTGLYAVSVPGEDGLTQTGDRQAYIAQAAYSTLTHFLEDRVCVADVWPEQSLLWGGVFASRQWLDPELPRATEFRDRWEVPAPPDADRDGEKVAVVFSHTGPGPNDLNEGAIIIQSPADIEAYDLMGNPVGRRQGPFLVAPFGYRPVYLVTRELDVVQFALRIASAELRGLLAVEMYVNPLTDAPGDGSTIRVRLDNHQNRVARGFAAGVIEGWELADPVAFALTPGENEWVELPVTRAAASADGIYTIELGLRTNVGVFVRRQQLQVARIAHQPATVDGQLGEWSAVPAFRIDSAEAGEPLAYLHWTRDPKAPKLTSKAGAAHVIARCRSAWDDQNLYVAVEVEEPALVQSWNGELVGDRPAEIWDEDFVQVALGINERAVDDARAADDPWRWKGHFRDTDYLYLLIRSAAGPKLVRLCKPGMPWRVPFQTDAVPGVEEVGKVAVRRDDPGGLTVYEAAIPRAELDLFKPETGEPVRLGFLVSTDEVGHLQSSVQAGVFDYWANEGSFMPTWTGQLYANQVLWGVAK